MSGKRDKSAAGTDNADDDDKPIVPLNERPPDGRAAGWAQVVRRMHDDALAMLKSDAASVDNAARTPAYSTAAIRAQQAADAAHRALRCYVSDLADAADAAEQHAGQAAGNMASHALHPKTRHDWHGHAVLAADAAEAAYERAFLAHRGAEIMSKAVLAACVAKWTACPDNLRPSFSSADDDADSDDADSDDVDAKAPKPS